MNAAFRSAFGRRDMHLRPLAPTDSQADAAKHILRPLAPVDPQADAESADKYY
jgi:hypothetical protein